MPRTSIGVGLLLSVLSARGWAQQPPAPPAAATPAPPASRPPDAVQPLEPPKAEEGARPHQSLSWPPQTPTAPPAAASPEAGAQGDSQFKYSNSLATHSTYTDHLGNVHDVVRRNDIQLTRDVFYFSGYAFDPRLNYNILIFTSSATGLATAAGLVGFVFNKGFALMTGFFSLPSTRSLTGTYPFFHGQDRSMADNYFRPGFTQGVWATGEPLPGFNYIAMLGNSLNTLSIKAGSLDNNRFAGALSVWWVAIATGLDTRNARVGGTP